MTSFDGFDEFAEELDEFAAQLLEFAAGIDDALDAGVRTTANRVQGTAKRNAPVDDGELRQDIVTHRTRSGTWVVESTADHAADVEFGTDPHPIEADDGYLRFEGKGGDIIFRKSVQHPGTPAQPYFRPAVREHESDLARDIQAELDELAREVFGT